MARAADQPNRAEVERLSDAVVESVGVAMEGVRLGRAGAEKPVRVEPECYLCGLWGHGCEHTLSHQAVRLGVPAFQLETPISLRRELPDGTWAAEGTWGAVEAARWAWLWRNESDAGQQRTEL